MRRRLAVSWFAAMLAGLAPAAAQTKAPALNAPLPNPTELWRRALDNERKLAAEQERYECRVTSTLTLTDSRGNPQKTTTEVIDQFYVNGIEIHRTLQRNGKDLTPEQAKKEDERVMKETLKYSNPETAQKEEAKQNQAAEDFMTAMMLTNGHRAIVDGRSVLFYDIAPNPRIAAKNVNQRIARILKGTVEIDEPTGETIDMNVRSVADLKIGGGLLANIHKGFWLHIHNHPQPDGVWMTGLFEGSGDARVLLFSHKYGRVSMRNDNCHPYTATATQVGKPTVVKTH